MASAGLHKPATYARSSTEKTKQKSKVVCKPLSLCAEIGKERIVNELTAPHAGVTTIPTEGESVDESPVREKRRALAHCS